MSLGPCPAVSLPLDNALPKHKGSQHRMSCSIDHHTPPLLLPQMWHPLLHLPRTGHSIPGNQGRTTLAFERGPGMEEYYPLNNGMISSGKGRCVANMVDVICEYGVVESTEEPMLG